MTTPPVDYYPSATTPTLQNYPGNYSAPQPPDRTGLLIGVGICQLLMSLAPLCLYTLLLLGAVIGTGRSSAPASTHRSYVLGSLIMFLASAFLVVMGIGAIQAKRWARALMNAASWLWLVFGIIISLALAAILPRTLNASGHMSRGGIIGTTIFVCCFLGFFMIIVPGIFILIYGSPAVKATCERKNPAASWTDRLPTGPMILLLLIAFTAATDIYAGTARPIFPLFGKYLTNWPARGAFFAVAVWRGFLAWDCFYLRVRAWRASLVTYVVVCISATVTYVRADIGSALGALGTKQSAITAASRIMKNPAYLSVQIGAMVAIVIFVAALRKYYTAALDESEIRFVPTP